MPTIGTSVDIAALVDAAAAGDSTRVITAARALLQQGAPTAEILGRVGMIAAHGDSDGHAILTLAAAAMISRWVLALPPLDGQDPQSHIQELPLLVQALVATAPIVGAGTAAHTSYPEPLFPSELGEEGSVPQEIHEAVYKNDAARVERLLFGLYGTGADYRTMEVRSYDGISTTFQNAGHPLMLAVRGFQLLDTVEWGDQATHILHWLTPHLPLHSEEPAWVNEVRAFNDDPAHSLASLRTRIAAPRAENAVPLRRLIMSNADTRQICQGVFDALVKGGASSRSVGSVIALTAADVMQMVGDGNRDVFVEAAHGLLFSAAVRLVFTQVQDIAALPLLFTSAAYINALQKAIGQEVVTAQMPTIPSTTAGGGLIAPALLDSLSEQLDAQDLDGAISTARRYLRLGNDPRALFAIIGLVAAQGDASADQGHTLQIVQAAGEEFLGWPAALADINIDTFLHVAMRAAAFATRNTLVANL